MQADGYSVLRQYTTVESSTVQMCAYVIYGNKELQHNMIYIKYNIDKSGKMHTIRELNATSPTRTLLIVIGIKKIIIKYPGHWSIKEVCRFVTNYIHTYTWMTYSYTNLFLRNGL